MKKRPLAERVWEKIKIGAKDECWPWLGTKNKDGYGSVGAGAPSRKTMLAHRAVFLVANGSLPADLEICHSCDRPACCNPSHLFAATHAENLADSKRKGRTMFVKRVARGVRNGGNKYTEAQIRRVRELGPHMTQTRIERETGIPQSHVSAILRGKLWRSLI